MKWLEYIKLALYEIWQNKTRTFLTLIGIIIGIAAVIVIVFIVQGAEDFLMQELEKIAPTDVMIAYGKWNNETRRYLGQITMDDVEYIREKEKDFIRAAAPRYGYSYNVRFAAKESECNIMATTPALYEIYGLQLDRGRFLSDLDIDNFNQVIVINHETAEELFKGRDPLGEKVQLYGDTFTIIGVLAKTEDSIIPISVNNRNVYIPISVFERVYGVKNRFTLMIRLKDRSLMQQEIRRIEDIFASRYGLTDERESKFYVRDWTSGLEQVTIIKVVLIILLSGVASITLFVAGIGLMNIMLVIVTERTREVGLRKALGATRADILTQFIIEAVVLCFTGGALGVLGGYLGSGLAMNIANNFIDFNYSVPDWAVIISFIFTTGVGIFFGIYPALKAARLDPIEALRYE